MGAVLEEPDTSLSVSCGLVLLLSSAETWQGGWNAMVWSQPIG